MILYLGLDTHELFEPSALHMKIWVPSRAVVGSTLLSISHHLSIILPL